jgi:hypothetical protein
MTRRPTLEVLGLVMALAGSAAAQTTTTTEVTAVNDEGTSAEAIADLPRPGFWEGGGIRVTEGTVLHPTFGIQGGYQTNVFYQDSDDGPEGPVSSALARFSVGGSFETLSRQRMDGVPSNRLVDRIVEKLPRNVYLSFDIDGLDPTLCPHTGTPVPGGLSFQEAVALVAGVARSGRRIVGLDLMEVAPGPEGDEWDGNVGARLLYKMIGYALKSQRA